MLNIPGQPILDKHKLIGRCSLLPVGVDAERLRHEVLALPGSLWGSRGGRVGVHSAAEAIFLRGWAPAAGELPIEEQPPLALMPYVRELIEGGIASRPMRCLLAKLPAGAAIAPHVDQAPYFGQTIRIHIPIITSERCLMYADGVVYRMRTGQVWALNNSAVHAVWNADGVASRTHLICDFLPDDRLTRLLEEADRGLGQPDPSFPESVRQYLAGSTAETTR